MSEESPQEYRFAETLEAEAERSIIQQLELRLKDQATELTKSRSLTAQTQIDLTEARNHIQQLKDELAESNRVRDIYKEQHEGVRFSLGESLAREAVLNRQNKSLTKSIDELKSMLYRRDLDISRIQGQLDLLLQQQTSATIEVPREVWNERSSQRNYNGDSPNGASHHFSWWNIGNAD